MTYDDHIDCDRLLNEAEEQILKLKAELKKKDELLFAYESVKAPVNPLLAENKRLRAELEQHRWIPVSERLPKHSCRLLAYGKDGYGYVIVAAISYDLEFEKFKILSEVTHWKPIILPEQALKP